MRCAWQLPPGQLNELGIATVAVPLVSGFDDHGTDARRYLDAIHVSREWLLGGVIVEQLSFTIDLPVVAASADAICVSGRCVVWGRDCDIEVEGTCLGGANLDRLNVGKALFLRLDGLVHSRASDKGQSKDRDELATIHCQMVFDSGPQVSGVGSCRLTFELSGSPRAGV